jgi:membrane protein implicated in regulation of membrane protease activity
MNKKPIIRTGAYTILVVGILLLLALFLGGLLLFVTYPEASFAKKMIVLGGLLIACAGIILITLSLFESLTEVVKLENEVKEILEDEKNDTKSVEKNV